jgi:gliding motility-associated-like protein
MKAQCVPCGAITFTINLSSKADTAYVQNGPARSGTCCTGSNCVNFVVYLNPGSDLLSFNVTNPAPSGSAFYQINCGPQISIGTPACVPGGASVVCITYCKPGGDQPNYHITASKTVKANPDFTVRTGCAQSMTVGGLSVPSITWTSVSPGITGQYNSYLSCSVGCATTIVNPSTATPSVINYMVSGSPLSGCPGTNRDTVKVTIVPGMSVNITPTNPVVCSGGTGSVALTATVAGGQTPYTYTWSTGANTPSINAIPGTYTVLVGDATSGCAPISRTITVNAITTPTAPTVGSNSPICAGQTLSLTAAPQPSVTYSWTGPNSFTSAVQNPTIASAGTVAAGVYSVIASFSGCISPPGTATVVVNPIPGTPTASANSPICAGQTLSLTASTIAGASYNWSGPNSFSSTLQNPTIAGITSAGAGTYSVSATAAGCTGSSGTVAVTVNTVPVAPTAGANTPLCAGQTLSLTASTIAGATYSWTGPNSFSSNLQNPTITGATTLATGIYSVAATVGGCPGPFGTISVTVNPIPAAPTASANSPICAGQTLSLTASTIASATYTWNGPNSFSSGVQNPTIAGATTLASGIYTVRATVAGCQGPGGTISVTVNPIPSAPIAGNNSPVCAGQTINLNASPVAGATYTWNGPNAFTSNVQNPSIPAASTLAAGVYTVRAIVAGCTSPNGLTTVTVNPIPGSPIPGSNSPICAGQNLNLSASAISGATYNWSGPNSFTSNIQNPTITGATTLASGVYSVNVTVAGCTGTNSTISVTVNPIPAAPVVGSNSPLCSGQTLSLSAAPIAGATYTWNGPNSFTSNLQNPTITGATTLAAGTYSVRATVAGCQGPAGTGVVTVNQSPPAPTAGGTATLCAGSTVSLTASTIAGATYNWTGPNSFTSNVQNPTIAAATTSATGMYSVTASVGGCTGPAGTFSVTVFGVPASPTLTSNSPVCSGTTLSLTAQTIVGASYSWSGPNSFTSAVQNPTLGAVTLAAGGTYSVFISVMGCGSAASTVAVTINQTPAAPSPGSNSPVCAGQTINLTATPIAGATYSWTGPNSFTSTIQNPSITGATTLAAGIYSVRATVAGCTGPIGTTSVTVNPIPGSPIPGSNSPICAGQNLNLSASAIAGATYNWSGPNSFTASTQNPSIPAATTLASGVYSVNVTVAGCTGTNSTISVTVNPIPAAPIVSSNSPLCSGQTLSLSAAPIAGASYTWNGPNSFTSNLQNPTITGATTLAAGTYSVRATVAGCQGPAGTGVVTVNQTPNAPIAGGTSTLCAGSNINLTASNITGASYSWNGPNSFTSNIQNPTVTSAPITATGIYSVNATVAGCTGPAGTFSVTVYGVPASPTVSATNPACIGQTLFLTAQTVTGATYNWSGPNSFTSATQNPTLTNVTAGMAGTYSVLVSVMGCGSSASTVAVIVNPTPAPPIAGSNSPLCVGQNLNLNASNIAGATYSWTGPNTFSSNLQNPTVVSAGTIASGVYSVNATVAGCTGSNGTVNVVVSPIPATPTATANSPICAGQTLSLSANTIAGATYNWSGPNSFTSTTQNPNIPGASVLASGTYSVNVTVGGCTGSDGTISVTVNPVPAPTTASNNSPICALQTISLSAGTVAGATYSWTGPNSFTSNVQNPTITNASTLAAGVYSLTVNVSGCNSSAATTAVTVNPIPSTPVAGGTATLCAGSTISLTANNISGATYNWTGPNSFTSNIQNPTIPGATSVATGVYSVNATVAGCTGLNGTFSVTVIDVPSSPSLTATNPACIGQTLFLTAQTIPGASYSWTGPNSFTSSVQNPTLTSVTPAMAGTYSVLVSVMGCGSGSSTITVIVNPTPATPTVSSNSPICSGQTINLTAGTIAGASYNWTGPNTFTDNVQNPSIVGATTLAAGIYSVNATVAGCTGSNGTVNVVVNPIPAAPTASANSPLCVGQTLSLTANTIAGATYNWSGPNSFTASTQNPTIPGATTLASGVYTLNVTVSGCTGPDANVSVTVSPIPSAPVASNNTPICAFQTLSLTASTIPGATYSWTGPNSFTSTTQNPTITGASTLAAGVYSVTATVGGCPSPAGVTTVTIDPAPNAPTASANSPLCIGGNINLNAGTISGATYSWSGPNSFTASVQNPTITGATTVAAGVYSVYATVAGCPGPTGTVNVIVSTPATITTGSNQTVCTNNNTVTLNGTSTTGSGIWTTSGTGTFAPNSLTGAYVPSASDNSSGMVTLTLTSTNNGGCPAVSSTMTITITPGPTANAGLNQSICANNSTVTLGGTVTIATGGVWSSSGTGTFTPGTTVSNPQYVPSASDISTGSVSIIYTTTGNGNCFPSTDTMIVTFFPAPVVSGGPNTQFVCKNNPNINLNATSTTGQVSWATLGSGTFTPSNTILNPTYNSSTADTTAGSVQLVITSQNNGSCNSVTDTITLVYTSTITISAGVSQTVCSNNPTVALNGTCTTGVGTWSSSGSGTFAPNTLTGTYVPSSSDISAGMVTLTVTSGNNGTCLPIISTMTVTINPGPTADAGGNQTVCANNATVALGGSVTVASGGQWSSSGTGTFSPNNTSLNTSYIPSGADTTAGSVMIFLTTTGNGNCFPTIDTMLISFTPAPLVIAPNMSVCKNNPNAVLNGYSSTGTGTWTTLGSGAFNPNNSVNNPTYTPSTADTTAGSVQIIFTSTGNGGCNAVSDTMLLTFSSVPTVTAGPSQMVCANNATVTLNGASSTTSGTWTSSGTGTFAPNTATGTYVPSSGDVSTGVVTLTLTTTNNGGCLAVQDILTLTITPAPTAMAGTDQTLCSNNASVALNGSVTIGTGGQWTSTGTGTFTPNNTSLGTTYLPSSADTTAGSVTLYLTTTGNGNCNAVTDTIVVNFTSAPLVAAGSDIFRCKSDPTVNLNGYSSTGTGTWTTLGSGSFNPNNSTLNAGYIPSSADTSAGSVILILTSTNNGGCNEVVDTVMVTYQPKPIANFTSVSKCVNTVTTFTDMSTGSPVTWNWTSSAGTSTLQSPAATFTATGNQTVSLVVTNAGGCSDSITKTVYINENPTTTFTFAPFCDSVMFASTSSSNPNVNGWAWDFGDTTFSSIQNPNHTYSDTGMYIVTLMVTTDSGCVASRVDTVLITPCDDNIIISNPGVPSGFTPNGDGKNDFLFVKGGPFSEIEFRVFNEWGNQIFRTTDSATGWDGTFKNAPQTAGRYLWTLTCKVIDGREFKMSGEVILSR